MNSRFAIPAMVLLLGAGAAMGCRKIPLTSPTPIPSGTVVFRFTRKVHGPMELSLDGTRIPVTQLPKGARSMVIRGLAPGKHRFFLSSAREIFSPDLGDLDMPSDKGVYQIVLTQSFDAVLYGKPDPLPPAEGLPGVTAALVK
ncbi:MAG TPA: hypothetical protein VF768_05550 [Holophagaceae bacterium]